MGNYNYKLQTVLDFKASIQDQMMLKYSNAKKELENSEKRLNDFLEDKRKIENEKDDLDYIRTIKDLKNYNSYIEQSNYKINNQKKMINKVKKEVNKAKDNLITASKDKKVFEKLKENDYKKHLDLMKKKEAITVDEIVTFISCNN